jgi:EAL domain
VPVRPHLLGAAVVQEALTACPDLHRVVVELTARGPVDDLATLRRRTDELRARGAFVALADAGAGSSDLQRMAALRPQLVTLDRTLVTGADGDPVRRALAEMVGEFAGRIGARVVAAGIETPGALATCARLGVPLAQGWLLGRPAPGFTPPAPEVVRLVRGQVARARLTESVASLLRPVRQVGTAHEGAVPAPAVVVDPLGEPLALRLQDPRTAEDYTAPVSLRVSPSADIVETLQRALTRPPAQRFDPVLCTDPTGAVLGLLRVEDLASAGHSR